MVVNERQKFSFKFGQVKNLPVLFQNVCSPKTLKRAV